MIEYINIFGANGQQVSLNLDDNVYPVHDFNVTYDVQADDTQKAQDTGSWPAFDYLGNAHLSIQGQILGNDATDYMLKRRQLRAPFVPQSNEGQHVTCRVYALFDGYSEEVYLDCNLDGNGPDLPITAGAAIGDFNLALLGRDPRWLSSIIQDVTLIVPSQSVGGFTMPLSMPLILSGASSTIQDIYNAGDAPTDPVIVVQGPCSEPSFSVFRSDGRSEMFQLTGLYIPDGQTVQIDFRAKTITMNGQYDVYSRKKRGSIWWQLLPGVNNVEFNAINVGANCSADIAWQNAYIV